MFMDLRIGAKMKPSIHKVKSFRTSDLVGFYVAVFFVQKSIFWKNDTTTLHDSIVLSQIFHFIKYYNN